MAIKEAVTAKKCDFLTLTNGMAQLKRAHYYHYQMQAAMFCARQKWCNFVVRTTVDFHCERIEYDKTFCESFLHKLRRFYFVAILPEFAVQHKPII